MKNIFEKEYIERPEERLRHRLLNRNTNRSQTDNPKLSHEQKRKLQSLDPDDRLYYLRNLGYSSME